MSWIDQIELCLEQYVPEMLNMPWREKTYFLGDIESEKRFLEEVRKQVKGGNGLNPAEIVRIVYKQCGQEIITSSDDPLDRKMIWTQTRELGSVPLFTRGGHTHTHQILSQASRGTMEQEICKPIQLLKSKANFPEIRHFSYSEGFEGSYTEETIQLLKSSGIECFPAAIEGVNEFDADPFQLKRIAVV